LHVANGSVAGTNLARGNSLGALQPAMDYLLSGFG